MKPPGAPRGLFTFYESRQAKLVAHLRNRPTGACALIEILFARRNDRRLHLMLSEVIGNLEVLEVRGQITRALINGEYLFRATGLQPTRDEITNL